MATKTSHPCIRHQKEIGGGRAIISGTRTRVSNIVAYYKLGLSAEELAQEFPHLTLSRIHDALSYYYEHREEIDREIDEESEEHLKRLIRT